MRTIEIKGSEFEFNPAEVTVEAGEEVEIVFQNTGSMPHNFTVGELDVDTDNIDPGEQTEIKLEVPEDGKDEYEFWCNIPGHRAEGMKGKLLVE